MNALQIALIAWVVVGVWIGAVLFLNRKQHPKALFKLFFVELWERFSFYGMRALLVLYMSKALLYGDEKAYGVYGAYGALVYTTPVIGGLIADRLIGYRKAITLGAVLMAIGHFVMAFEHEYFFYSALALLIVGNGFFKPNISSLIGQLYPEGDGRRDAGFTLFYMGINAGALLAPLTCGAIGETYGWHYGFGLAGVGMFIGLIVFLRSHKTLEGKGEPPNRELLERTLLPGISNERAVTLGAFLVVPLLAVLVNQNALMSVLLPLVGGGIMLWLIVHAFKSPKVERDRLFVVIVLTLFSVLFWAFFEQAGSSISLFTDRNVDRTLGGGEIPTSAFQSVNPAFIILLAPLFSFVWTRLSRWNAEPATPTKFVLALIQIGLGFFVLVLGAKSASADGKVALYYLVLGYMLHTTGELCLSPVGLSMVTKLSPPKIVGLVMGTWFLSSAFAHHIGGLIAKLTAVPAVEGSAPASPAASLPVYADVFEKIAWASLGAAVLLAVLVPFLKRWMHGVDDKKPSGNSTDAPEIKTAAG